MENQNNQQENSAYNMNRLMNPGASVNDNTPLDAGINSYDPMVDAEDAERRKKATRDMIFGLLWCLGGTVATFSNTGFIFYGAIIFGAIQFVRGVINYGSN